MAPTESLTGSYTRERGRVGLIRGPAPVQIMTVGNTNGYPLSARGLLALACRAIPLQF